MVSAAIYYDTIIIGKKWKKSEISTLLGGQGGYRTFWKGGAIVKQNMTVWWQVLELVNELLSPQAG